jgi:hypothetical protein
MLTESVQTITAVGETATVTEIGTVAETATEIAPATEIGAIKSKTFRFLSKQVFYKPDAVFITNS